MKPSRRDILKTVVLAPLMGLIRPAKAKEPEWTVTDVTPGPNRAVWYGIADRDIPKGLVVVAFRSWLQIDSWPSTNYRSNNGVIVHCLEPIKKGQSLVWFPDGSIRGGKSRCELTRWGPQHNLK